MDYENYEKLCQENKKRNEVFLECFEQYLESQQLSSKTIRNHLGNVAFYLNNYLIYYEVNSMESGCYKLGGFLGDFFIRKCMWSTPATVKSTASSIKKFYKCMLEKNFILEEDYSYLCRDIKEWLDEWVSSCARYNNF